MDHGPNPLNRKQKAIPIIILLCIILATALTYVYYANVFKQKPKDIIAVIEIQGAILYPQTAQSYSDRINYAIKNETIKGVVLLIDSPGGEVTKIERLYLDLLELKKKKPVVSYAISALSGGYYIAVAADYIYVQPSSYVGNVGVIAQSSPAYPPSEQILETGVYKLTGSSKLSFLQDIDTVLNNFVQAVKSSRGDRLRLSETELKKAKIYTGADAVSLGLADGIGSIQTAVEKVAKEANLEQYEVINLFQAVSAQPPFERSSSYANLTWLEIDIETLSKINPPPAVYYLYLPPKNLIAGSSTGSGAEERPENVVSGSGERKVIVDLSHGNTISRIELDTLVWELVRRNITIKFVYQWSELRAEMEKATALIVAIPQQPYSSEEKTQIKNFVENGGILLLLYDPAKEYSETPASLEAINSIANSFRLSFANGYVYDEHNYYGVYRNVIVRNFLDNPLTEGVRSLAFFTATYVRSNGQGIAWTSQTAASSQSEKTGEYPIITFSKNNGTVIAIGDITFITEPYCYLEDNYKLLSNIAEYIASYEKYEKPE